ncbi:MAG: hypothetical protein DMG72_09810 [Acidobacteria bacterium]|nr:MAG: hypothetical protein DMG72_09810 [Acidobacteriota bacterium]
MAFAALKGRSSTVLHAFTVLHACASFSAVLFQACRTLDLAALYDMAEAVPFHNCVNPRVFRKPSRRRPESD